MRMLLAMVVAILAPSALAASVVEVTPKASTVLNTDFSSLDPQPSLDGPIVELPPRDEPYLIQVDVSMRLYDLQPGQVGFSNTAFNATVLGDGAAYSDLALGIPRWVVNNPELHPSGPFPGISVFLWEINQDAGRDSNDLHGVLLAGITRQFGNPNWDFRRNLGQSEGGTLAGRVYVELPASSSRTTALQVTTPWGASTYDEAGFSTADGNTALGGQTVTFIVVPEPSAAALLVIGLLSLALRIRR